jgi:hypothetical protein
MPTVIVTPTILAGQSLSDSIDTTGGNPEFIVVPSTWTPANISFQLSTDGNNFGDLFDASGRELIMPCVSGSTIMFDPLLMSIKGAYFKIRSGSRDHPVKQAQDVQFSVAVST